MCAPKAQERMIHFHRVNLSTGQVNSNDHVGAQAKTVFKRDHVCLSVVSAAASVGQHVHDPRKDRCNG